MSIFLMLSTVMVEPTWSQFQVRDNALPADIDPSMWFALSDRSGVELLEGPNVEAFVDAGGAGIKVDGLWDSSAKGRLWVLLDDAVWVPVALSE
jgi:hypothetical protein